MPRNPESVLVSVVSPDSVAGGGVAFSGPEAVAVAGGGVAVWAEEMDLQATSPVRTTVDTTPRMVTPSIQCASGRNQYGEPYEMGNALA
jgi:hypothetical protein